MKKIQYAILIFTAFMLSVSAFGQFGFGVEATTSLWQSKILGHDMNPTLGFGGGLQAFYNLKPKIRVRLGVDYIAGVPKKYDPEPSYNQTVKVSNMAVSPDLQYAFYGSFKRKSLAVFAFAGLDINNYHRNVSVTEVVLPYPGGPSHSTSYYFSVSKKYTQFTPHAGLGAEYGVSENLRVFLELKYSFGHIINSASIDTYNPPYTGVDIGLRFGFKKN